MVRDRRRGRISGRGRPRRPPGAGARPAAASLLHLEAMATGGRMDRKMGYKQYIQFGFKLFHMGSNNFDKLCMIRLKVNKIEFINVPTVVPVCKRTKYSRRDHTSTADQNGI